MDFRGSSALNTPQKRISSRYSTPNTALTAVALQDHLIKNLSLNDPFKQPNMRIKPKTKRKEIRAVVDTGLGKPCLKPIERKDKEYVLDKKPATPSLAQKFGLVEAPEPLLSEQQWKEVKTKSNQREDSIQPCVICKEDFGLEQQVLLSCSHVFHRGACLEAFERFTGKKTCPMCRKQQYQTRVIYEGKSQHRIACATRIQAYWRGYVVRSWYKKLRATVPPKNPSLRKKFYENKLSSIMDRMVKSCEYDINSFFHDIDESVEESRRILQTFDGVTKNITEEEWTDIQIKAVERGDVDCPICLTTLVDPGLATASTSLKSHAAKKKATNSTFMTEINESKSRMKGKVRERVLLSCSHVFHKTCCEAFEEFAVGARQNQCPVCRSAYQKRSI